MRHTTLYTTQARAGYWVLAMLIATAAVMLVTTPAARAGNVLKTIEGKARVVDGDTLEIAGLRIRLEGIDAPERGQTCNRAWLPLQWRCGRSATRALRRLVSGHIVKCRSRGLDAYDRIIAVCFVGDDNINAAMVRQGNAWAFTKYSTSYVTEQKLAQQKKRGVWRAKTETPWDYRAARWQSSDQAAPQGCPIKGNITDRGRIYHMPWSPWYKRVRINEAEGERWFCSEDEAAQAGWRPVGGA